MQESKIAWPNVTGLTRSRRTNFNSDHKETYYQRFPCERYKDTRINILLLNREDVKVLLFFKVVMGFVKDNLSRLNFGVSFSCCPLPAHNGGGEGGRGGDRVLKISRRITRSVTIKLSYYYTGWLKYSTFG